MTRKNRSNTEWSTRRVVYALLRSFSPAFCLGWDSTRSSSANELQKRRGRILCLLLHSKSLMRSSSPTDPTPKAKEIALSLSLSLVHQHRLDLVLDYLLIMFRRKHSSNDDLDNAAPQEEKVKELRAAIGPLSGHSLMFSDDACLRRYLVARNWNIDKSKKMLQETLKWRATYKPEEIRWHEVAVEGETGKVYRADFQDREGRSVLVLRPGKQNTSSHDNQLRHLVYLLENAIINLPDGQEQMIWLIDFTGWSLSNSVPIKTARETANILQSHYPERLAAAFLYNPPRIFESFWKIVKYFLDPKTFQKVKFVYPKNEESMGVMHKNFDPEILPEEFGGKSKVQYDHDEFSKLMSKDDVKTASFWKPDEKTTLVAPEPAHFVAQAS